MIKLEDLKEIDIKYTWKTIIIGWELNLLSPKFISDYAIQCLEINNSNVDTDICELAYMDDDININEHLKKIQKKINFSYINEPGIKKNNVLLIDERKLRYSILKKIKNLALEKSKLLQSIEEVYSTFGYPADMDSFIFYMPSNDPNFNQYTQEQAVDKLLYNFNTFLESEKDYITHSLDV